MSAAEELDEPTYLPWAHWTAPYFGEELKGTMLLRNFLGVPDNEPTELTAFLQGRILVAHASDAEHHIQLVQEIQKRRDFNGCFQLVNGPVDPQVFSRYEMNRWDRAWNGRVTDAHIQQRRAIFIDVDPVRAKGISSTDEQLAETKSVYEEVGWFLQDRVGREAIAGGCSGNGWFLVIALEPSEPTKDSTVRIGKLLALMNKKFGTETVKVDAAVANPARLMPSPGTWKRKGRDTPDRPHRRATFFSPRYPSRVPLEALV